MRGPHPQSHVTLQYCGHATNKKRYISTFTRPLDHKLSNVADQDEKTLSTKLLDTLITWSCDKSKILYLHIRKGHAPINLARFWLRMMEPHPKSCRQTQQDTGHSVVITIEVCAEKKCANPSISAFLSFFVKKDYVKC